MVKPAPGGPLTPWTLMTPSTTSASSISRCASPSPLHTLASPALPHTLLSPFSRMPQDAERADLRDLADLARHRAQNLKLQQLGAVACAGCAVDAREGARTAIEPRRVGVRACMDREQNRTRRETDFCACVMSHCLVLACIHMVYTWAVAIQNMSFVRAVMSVYIISKCKYAYRKR